MIDPDAFKDLPDWCEPFITTLEYCNSPSEAARVAGVQRHYAYKFRQSNHDFMLLWEEARRVYLEVSEAKLALRALTGEDQLVVSNGRVAVVRTCCQLHPDDCECSEPGPKVPLTVSKPNDTLLMFQLKALAPEKYRDGYYAPPQEPETPQPPEDDLEKFARAIESVLSAEGS